MQITKLQAQHLEPILKIAKQQFNLECWTQQQFIDAFNNNAVEFYGIVVDNKLVCFASILKTIDDINLLDIATEEGYKRKGCAKQLLKYLISMKNESQTFSLEVKSKNLPAISLYEGLGFKTLHTRKKYYKDGDDAFCMFLN